MAILELVKAWFMTSYEETRISDDVRIKAGFTANEGGEVKQITFLPPVATKKSKKSDAADEEEFYDLSPNPGIHLVYRTENTCKLCPAG